MTARSTVFTYMTNFLFVLQSTKPIMMYQCESSICQQKFSSLKDLVRHEIYSCFYRLKMNCEQCKCEPDSRLEMDKHMDEHHATTRFCDLCPESFPFISELKIHNIEQHDVLYNPDI